MFETLCKIKLRIREKIEKNAEFAGPISLSLKTASSIFILKQLHFFGTHALGGISVQWTLGFGKKGACVFVREEVYAYNNVGVSGNIGLKMLSSKVKHLLAPSSASFAAKAQLRSSGEWTPTNPTALVWEAALAAFLPCILHRYVLLASAAWPDELLSSPRPKQAY